MEALLERYRPTDMTLPELVAAARALLEKIDLPSADERVRAFPDARTVRYYQTLGLVPKPRRYRGRSALYGFEHLLRVLAVKLLQAQDQSLAQIQRALAPASPERLEAAVREALAAGPPPPSPSRPLISAALRPGVIVTIDPTLVDDPDAVLRRLAASLDPASGGIR